MTLNSNLNNLKVKSLTGILQNYFSKLTLDAGITCTDAAELFLVTHAQTRNTQHKL